MKRFIAAASLLFAVLVTASASATINWQPNPEFTYRVDPNGGLFSAFQYLNQNGGDIDLKSSADGNDLSDEAVGNFYEFPLDDPSGSIHLYGAAKGSLVDDGIWVKAAAEVSLNGFTQGADVEQKATAWIARKFTLGEAGTFNLETFLEGPISFSTFFNSALYHGDYELVDATVTLEGFTDSYPTEKVFGLDSPVRFTDVGQSSEMLVNLTPTTKDGTGIIYTLKTTLVIRTDIQNAFFDQILGPLSGPFQVGEEAEPLQLQAQLNSASSDHTLTANTVGGGNVTLNPTGGVYNDGTTVTVTAVADAGWTFDGWTGDVADPESASTTITMDGDKSITATFAEVTDQYSLSVNTVGNGSVDFSPSGGVYNDGTTVTVTAVADAGWAFDGWTGDVADADSASSTVTMDGDKTITATFVEVTNQYSLSVNTVGNGSVSLSPSGGAYDEGTTVTVTAVADTEWEFGGWTGDVADADSASTTVTMDSDKIITATFTESPQHYSLSVNIEGNGSVNLDPPGGVYDKDTLVTMIAVPVHHWTFSGWSGDLTGDQAMTNVLMNGDKNITATFTQVLVPPIADAGGDRIVQEKGSVTLHGAGSFDPDGTVISHRWEQTGDGPQISFTDPSVERPSFTAPNIGNMDVLLTFQLTVTDNDGLENSDVCQVTVVGQNEPPNADAGADLNVEEGASVVLDASNSVDPDYADSLSYRWAQIDIAEGTAVELSDADTAQARFTAPNVGPDGVSLIFLLTATDSQGLENTDTCVVNVTWENHPPQAAAGRNQTVTESDLVFLDARDSADPDPGDTLYYSWEQTDGEPLVAILDGDSAEASFVAPDDVGSDGVSLTFQVTVTDLGGLQSSDRCIVNIIALNEGNQPPQAVVGADQLQLVEEGTTVFLDASQSQDPDDGIVSYQWRLISGGPVTLSKPNAVQTTFVAPPVNGETITIDFEVIVTDKGGLSDKATVSVDVVDNGITDFPSDTSTTMAQSGDPIGIKCNNGANLTLLDTSIDPETLAGNGKPEKLKYGLIDVEIKVDVPETVVEFIVYLKDAAEDGEAWFKYIESKSLWVPFNRDDTSNGIDGAEFNATRDQVKVYITDNGPYDDDPTPGVVRDPSGLGTAATAEDASDITESKESNSGGGGGCFIETVLSSFG